MDGFVHTNPAAPPDFPHFSPQLFCENAVFLDDLLHGDGGTLAAVKKDDVSRLCIR